MKNNDDSLYPDWTGVQAFHCLDLLTNQIYDSDALYDELKENTLQEDDIGIATLGSAAYQIHTGRVILITNFIRQMYAGVTDDDKEFVAPSPGDKVLFHDKIHDMAQRLQNDITELERLNYSVSDDYKNRMEKTVKVVATLMACKRHERVPKTNTVVASVDLLNQMNHQTSDMTQHTAVYIPIDAKDFKDQPNLS